MTEPQYRYCIPTCPMCGSTLILKKIMTAMTTYGYYCEHCKSWKIVYKDKVE